MSTALISIPFLLEMTYSLKLDKENVHVPSVRHSPRPAKTTTLFSPTLQPQPQQRQPSPQQGLQVPTHQKPPPKSSKLIREHLSRVSLACGSSPPPRKRRLLDGGPVRMSNERSSSNSSTPNTSSTIPLSESPAVRRLGYEGTTSTSTTTTGAPRTSSPLVSLEFSISKPPRNPSRNSNSPPDAASTNSMASDVESVWADLASPSPSKNNSPFHYHRRLECEDPVAFTLLRGGPEDLNYLLQQDHRQNSTSRASRGVIPLAVSGNLHDIYQDGGVDKLARPVPVLARPRYCN
jgi:hypothetical protein